MKNKDFLFYLINLLYGAFMILYSLIPSIVVAIISLLIFMYDYLSLSKKHPKTISLFYTSILFLPVSFVSILGTNYASLPLTWFSVSVLILMIISIINNKIKKIYAFFYLLFILVFVISLYFTNSYISSLSQFFTVSLCLFAFQIGELLKKDYSTNNVNKGIDLYLLSSLSFAIQILIQRFYILRTGIVIGHYSIMGGNRIAYAGLMSDYSFASLYLVTASFLLFLLFVKYKKISFIRFVLFFALFTFVSIMTSARTGLFSLVVCIMLYILLNFNKKSAGRILLIVILGIVAIPFALHFMSSLRSLDSFLDGSGRIEITQRALSIFKTRPIFGVGFGIENLKYNYGLILPHNYFVQYLLQFGIVGTIVVTLNFIVFYFKNNKYNYLMWMFILCFIGSMLIPDIFSSRFLSVIIILIIINQKGVESNGESKKKEM